MKKVGFIGLGIMGKPMAKNVVKKGFPLTVYDLAKAPVDELVQMGAVAASSPKQVGEVSETVILMVPDEPDVEAVLYGEKGVIEGFRGEGTIIVMSTVNPLFMKALAERVAKRGVKILDAPVFRGAGAAAKGTLGIMAGGEKDVLDDCRPILAAMGSDIFHCGGIGMGEVVKIISNYLSLSNNAVISEAMVLGVKLGAKADTLFDILLTGSGYSWSLEHHWGPWVLKGNFEPGFKIDLAVKDIGIAMASARKLKLPLLLGTAAEQMYQYASSAGKGDKDIVSLTLLLEEIAGIKVRSEKRSG